MLISILLALQLLTHTNSEKILFDFKEKSSVQTWNIINDGVMGGLSSSQIRWSPEGHAIFFGTVSLENNGGFASVRSAPQDFQLAGFQGISLRVKGDGNTYKFRIRTNDYFDGVAYSVDFPTAKGQWEEIRLPFSSLLPTFRGRVLTNVGALQPEAVRQLGFLIGDKQRGDFALVVDEILAY